MVVNNGGPAILGRNFLREFNIKEIIVNNLNKTEIKVNDKIKNLLHKYSNLFDNIIGKFKYEKIQLNITKESNPIFIKPR